MRPYRIALGALALAMAAVPAAASTTITFNDVAWGGYTSLTTHGFTFERPGSTQQFTVYPQNIPANADPNGQTLALTNGGAITVHAADNSTFDLISLDIAEITNNVMYSLNINTVFTFYTASGSTSQTVAVDNVAGFQNILFNQTDLTSFTVTGGGRYVQLDNIVLNSAADAGSAVPEPASWAMMLTGFGLMGGLLRWGRRRPAMRFS